MYDIKNSEEIKRMNPVRALVDICKYKTRIPKEQTAILNAKFAEGL